MLEELKKRVCEQNIALVFIGSLLMMSGYLAGMAVFGAKIRDLIPEGKSGMFQGVRIFSQVFVPGIVGPKIGELILRGAEKIQGEDGTFSFLPNQNIFLGALVAAAIATAMMYIFRNRKAEKGV
jgi:hypothetical protein